MPWYDSIVELGNNAVDAYSTVKDANGKPVPAAPAATPSKLPTWVLPVAIGGGVLLLLVVLISSFRK